jgi:hypothetical protein
MTFMFLAFIGESNIWAPYTECGEGDVLHYVYSSPCFIREGKFSLAVHVAWISRTKRTLHFGKASVRWADWR